MYNPKYVYMIHLGDGKHKRGVCADPLETLRLTRKHYPRADFWALHSFPAWACKKISAWLNTKLTDVGCNYWRKQSPEIVRAWLDKIIGVPPMRGREQESLQLMLDCNRDA